MLGPIMCLQSVLLFVSFPFLLPSLPPPLAPFLLPFVLLFCSHLCSTQSLDSAPWRTAARISAKSLALVPLLEVCPCPHYVQSVGSTRGQGRVHTQNLGSPSMTLSFPVFPHLPAVTVEPNSDSGFLSR